MKGVGSIPLPADVSRRALLDEKAADAGVTLSQLIRSAVLGHQARAALAWQFDDRSPRAARLRPASITTGLSCALSC